MDKLLLEWLKATTINEDTWQTALSSVFHISPKPIRDKEIYQDYVLRVEQEEISANRTSGNRWTNEELEALKEAIENGVTQLEMAAALPHRS